MRCLVDKDPCKRCRELADANVRLERERHRLEVDNVLLELDLASAQDEVWELRDKLRKRR